MNLNEGVSAGSVVAAMLAIGCDAEAIFKLNPGCVDQKIPGFSVMCGYIFRKNCSQSKPSPISHQLKKQADEECVWCHEAILRSNPCPVSMLKSKHFLSSHGFVIHSADLLTALDSYRKALAEHFEKIKAWRTWRHLHLHLTNWDLY